jgi:hypothetical protein
MNLESVFSCREQGEARHLKALRVGGVWRASRPNVGCLIAFIVSQPIRPCTALHVLRRATLLRQLVYNYDKWFGRKQPVDLGRLFRDRRTREAWVWCLSI